MIYSSELIPIDLEQYEHGLKPYLFWIIISLDYIIQRK
jgi:hypothetical protein